MSFPSISITRKEAAEIARRLNAAGYKTTAKQCYAYVMNVIDNHAGADPDARKEVATIIEDVLVADNRIVGISIATDPTFTNDYRDIS